MTSSPMNLQCTAFTFSPKGNADNVLLHIPAGMANTYTTTSRQHAAGAYWYTAIFNGLTTAQVYTGWRTAGHRTGPTATCRWVTDKRHSRPQHAAAVQFRLRPLRQPGATQQSHWPQF